MNENIEKTRCFIIGSGPAGYTSAIYASRAALNPILYEGLQPGGQLTMTTEIDNFPGYPNGVKGFDMMEDLKKQAMRFGADVRFGYVSSVDFSSHPFKVTIDETKLIEADTVIIATGATANWLGIHSERRLSGSGVSACATCDGFFFRGQKVAVVGGGDTACEEATYLSHLCKEVIMIVRRDQLRASKVMQDKVLNTPNIKIMFNHVTQEILGNKAVEGILLKNIKTDEDVKIELTGVFIAIGHTPNTKIFNGQIDLDENGYIITKPNSTATNIPGVFAAGDVRDHVFRQAITAAGNGCMAAIEAERFLCTR